MERTAGAGAPTIYDVAKAAGVSPSTVSRALSRPDRVSFHTAEHVRQVAIRIGYLRQSRSRARSDSHTGVIAMMVADITNPVFTALFRSAEQAAADAGLALLLAESQESASVEATLVDRLASTVDGLILTGSRLSDAKIRRTAKRVPLVVLNRIVSQVPSVVADNIRGVKRAAEYLAELGHREITYLAGPEASWADWIRWRGMREATLELDLRLRRIGPCAPTIRGGETAGPQWQQHPTSAVMTYNDLIAVGFLRWATGSGIAVPGAVSVVGFDNIVEGSLVTPRLTTLAPPLSVLGTAAVSHLITAPRDSETHRTLELPMRLILRESTGPAPAREPGR